MSQTLNRIGWMIICDGRINLHAAHDRMSRIQATSRCAVELVTYYGDRLGEEDTRAISELQHEMMEAVTTRRSRPAGSREMPDEMFALLDALEEKMSSDVP